MQVDELIMEAEKLSEDDKASLLRSLSTERRRKESERIREAVKSHEKYVGKCYVENEKPMSGMFPEMRRYYKVVSARAENEYRMTVLTFPERPLYWFDYQNHRIGLAGDGFLGEYEFIGIETDDFPFFCRSRNGGREIDRLTEIPESEFFEALDAFVEELKKMKWPADHYRFGNRTPADEDWKKEN